VKEQTDCSILIGNLIKCNQLLEFRLAGCHTKLNNKTATKFKNTMENIAGVTTPSSKIQLHLIQYQRFRK